MKKKWTLAALAVLVVVASFVVYRLGCRSLTILRNDVPAAGETIERMGPEGLERLTLDAHGCLELPWGLSQSHAHFWFRAADDRNYLMQLPVTGQRLYQVWDRGLTRVDILFEFGPFAWTRRVQQE